MLTWYIIGQASARPSVVCGGTYVLNKPDGQVVLIPSVIIMHGGTIVMQS
jgi:hypothetical protein